MKLNIDPKVDYAFKFVFGNEARTDILLALLNAVFGDSHVPRIKRVKILNPFTEKASFTERQAILDVRALDETERESIVEMQMVTSESLNQRFLYYWAKRYSQRLRKGQDYDSLKPVKLICFLNDILFPDEPGYHSVYELRSRETGTVFSDHLSIHLIELPKFVKTIGDLASDLDCWLYLLKHAQQLDSERLPQQLAAPGIDGAVELLETMAHTMSKREVYEARLKFERDENMHRKSAMNRGHREGLEKGLQRGIQKGLQQGLMEGRVNAIAESVLTVGELRLGPPPVRMAGRVRKIKDEEQLQSLLRRVVQINAWKELIPVERSS